MIQSQMVRNTRRTDSILSLNEIGPVNESRLTQGFINGQDDLSLSGSCLRILERAGLLRKALQQTGEDVPRQGAASRRSAQPQAFLSMLPVRLRSVRPPACLTLSEPAAACPLGMSGSPHARLCACLFGRCAQTQHSCSVGCPVSQPPSLPPLPLCVCVCVRKRHRPARGAPHRPEPAFACPARQSGRGGGAVDEDAAAAVGGAAAGHMQRGICLSRCPTSVGSAAPAQPQSAGAEAAQRRSILPSSAPLTVHPSVFCVV